MLNNCFFQIQNCNYEYVIEQTTNRKINSQYLLNDVFIYGKMLIIKRLNSEHRKLKYKQLLISKP